jgi:hypothetical protein
MLMAITSTAYEPLDLTLASRILYANSLTLRRHAADDAERLTAERDEQLRGLLLDDAIRSPRIGTVTLSRSMDA